MLNHSHRRAEAAQSLREFKAHIPSTQYDHGSWQTVEIEDFHVSHGFCNQQARNIWDGGARSQVEKHLITGDRPLAPFVKVDLNRLRTHEPGFPRDEFRSRSLEAIEMKLNLTLYHLSLAVQDAVHVRRYRSCLDPIFRAVPREPIRFRAANHVLARQAGNVRARSTDVFSFHYRRAVARLRHCPRQVLSRFSASDNKDLVVFCVRHSLPPCMSYNRASRVWHVRARHRNVTSVCRSPDNLVRARVSHCRRSVLRSNQIRSPTVVQN